MKRAQHSSNSWASSLTLLLGALVSGCGGGGGSGGGPAPPPAPANTAPQIPAFSIATQEDQPGSFAFTVSDGNGDPISLTITTLPLRGIASITGTNPFTLNYLPEPQAHGTETLVISASDGRGGVATATVNVTVVAQNDTPEFGAQQFSGNEDAAIPGQLVAADVEGDALSFSAVTQPAHGSVAVAADGAFIYTGDANYNGADSFEAQVSDGTATRTATVSLSLAPVNDLVLLNDDAVTVETPGPVDIDVLANDVNVDNDFLPLGIDLGAGGATAEIVDNKIRLTPPAGGAGPAWVRYGVTDNGVAVFATLRVIFGSARPLFYFTGEARTSERRIRRYDVFSNVELSTPVPAAEALEAFSVSDDARKLVYVTRNPSPVRHRLWIRDLEDLSAPVREVATPAGFFTNYLRVSPDGSLVAFNEFLASTSTPDQRTVIDTAGVQIQIPTFTRDSRKLFYSVALSGGGHIIKRADVSAAGVIGNRTQMTHDFMVGEGLGIDFRLTPDESRIVSIGRMPSPMLGTRLYAFVTAADGSMSDLRLNGEYSQSLDGTYELPDLTTDGRYAVYRSIQGGVSGLYMSDLQAPGTQRLLSADSPYIGVIQAVGANQVIFGNNSATPGQYLWSRANLFAPYTSWNLDVPSPTAARLASAAPDGSRVLFDNGNVIFSARFLDYGYEAASVGRMPDEDLIPGKIIYAPDSSTAVVLGRAGISAQVVSPKFGSWLHEWKETLIPAPAATFSEYCVAYAGQACF